MTKPKSMLNYVLDSFALLSYYQGESGASQVARLLRQAQKKEAAVFVSQINVGEVFYVVGQYRSLEAARKILANLSYLPLKAVLPNKTDVIQAAQYKIGGGISYADVFALQLAVSKKARLVTGDKEFARWEKEVGIIWI